jgi:hypothetical protein
MQLGNSELLLKRQSNEIECCSIMYNCTFIVYFFYYRNEMTESMLEFPVIFLQSATQKIPWSHAFFLKGLVATCHSFWIYSCFCSSTVQRLVSQWDECRQLLTTISLMVVLW